ncbi:MAG TPA: YkuS family protein [Caproiciproducens sp.]|nr:YkuS family protein [Caproiciproducens sp.]
MKGKIAVEQNLTPVKDYLSGKGYQVECLDIGEESSSNLQNYDAIVVTGQNTNFLGVHDTKTKAAVINADGLSPEEVEKEIENNEKSVQ